MKKKIILAKNEEKPRSSCLFRVLPDPSLLYISTTKEKEKKLAVQIAPTIVVSSFEVLRQQQPQAASFLRGLRWWHRLAIEPWRERRALSAAKHLPTTGFGVSLLEELPRRQRHQSVPQGPALGADHGRRIRAPCQGMVISTIATSKRN